MEFHLYPPFLVVPEEHAFPDAWEAFCCKLLNLMEKRDDIYRRTPPESGIDLYCAATRTAYQCKSVESGQAGGFSTAKAIESLQAARRVKDAVGWTNYVLCTNVDLTGHAEQKLRDELPEMSMRAKSYWLKACERYSDEVAHNFRRIVVIPRRRTEAALKAEFSSHYGEELEQLMKARRAVLYLYSSRDERVHRLDVSLDFRVRDLVRVLTKAFGLPKQAKVTEGNLSVLFSHGLASNGTRLPAESTLRECGIKNRSLITYWTELEVVSDDGRLQALVMNRDVLSSSGFRRTDLVEVVARCDELIRSALAGFYRSLEEAGGELG